MPNYEYRCEKCGKKFVITMSVAEKQTKKVRCPNCNATKVSQEITSFYAKTSKKS